MIGQFLTLLAVHWVADFAFQSHWMASNKSKSNEALMLHVVVYMSCFAICVPFIFSNFVPDRWFVFVILNALLHAVTDYFTSRWSSRLWAKQDWHNFFVVIGLDQLIHQATLAGTMLLFFGSGA